MTTKKILVVDDEVVILNLFKKVFRKNGFTVRSAESAEEALEILKHDRINLCTFQEAINIIFTLHRHLI